MAVIPVNLRASYTAVCLLEPKSVIKKKTCENVQSADWPSASEAGATTVNKGSVLCSG